MLDDEYLINRQFGRIALERLLDIRLEDYGYRFYMTSDERRSPLAGLRRELVEDDTPVDSPASPESKQ